MLSNAAVTKIARSRLYVFGRKNRKLFDREYRRFFEGLAQRISEGFDFRCLFLDPQAPKHVMKAAHTDDDFPIQLKSCLRDAIDMLKEYRVNSEKVCRTYDFARAASILVVDAAIIFAPIEFSPDGKARPLGRASFSVTGVDTSEGQHLIRNVLSAWEGGKPLRRV